MALYAQKQKYKHYALFMNKTYPQKVSRSAGYALHVMTACGAVLGMLGLQAVYDNQIRMALLWLIASQVLDGLDGPIARKLDVCIHAPKIDGHILDLVVDYVTCVVVPVAFLVHFKMLPVHYETIIAGSIFLFSALWFARTDLETDEYWFNGFPAVWNLVVPTFLVFESTPTQVAIISIILCISQLTNLKIPHLVRAKELRFISLPFGVIYIVNLILLSWDYSDLHGLNANFLTQFILLSFPIYIAIISIWKTLSPNKALPTWGNKSL